MNKKHVFATAEQTCTALAEWIVELSIATVNKKGSFTIALSGGSTPKQLFELLASDGFSSRLSWKNIYFFWSDERCVPYSHEDNNSRMADQALLHKVPVPKENIFPVPVNFEPVKAAQNYEETILSFFRTDDPQFDLVLLGLGENGHTASLFPHSEILKEKKRFVREAFIAELNAWRISFTVRLIRNATHQVFLVTGESKAEIVKIIFSKGGDPDELPALLISKDGKKVEWYLDSAAASLLKINA